MYWTCSLVLTNNTRDMIFVSRLSAAPVAQLSCNKRLRRCSTPAFRQRFQALTPALACSSHNKIYRSKTRLVRTKLIACFENSISPLENITFDSEL